MTSNHSNELNTHANGGGDSAHANNNNNHYQNGFNRTSDSKLSGYLNSNNVNNSSSLMHKNSISSINSDHNTSNGNPASSNGLHASNGTSLARNSSSSPNGSNANQQSSNSENNENHSNNNNNNDRMPSKLVSSQLQFTNGQKDILRLIGQHLRYLGLNRTTEMLINESGCMLEHPTAANFCNLIMGGHWDEV